MVVRHKNRRGTAGRWTLLASTIAGAALAATLTVAGAPVTGEAATGQLVPLGVVAPTPAPGGVTFEVLPASPTPAPTGSPTPRPTTTGGGHLPVTGDDPMPPGWLLAAGAVLLLLGALTVSVSRGLRRRRS